MALRIRRGTDAQRSGKVFEMGEIVYTTDSQQLWVGDGVTAGGAPVVGTNVAGYGLSYDSVTNKLTVSGLTADDITGGVNNKYFSTELAVDAVGAALVAGNATNVGITFTYAQTQDDAGRINATVALDGIGITDVVSDTTPQLGGDLDLNNNDIFGAGNIDIDGTLSATTGLGANLNLNDFNITGTGDIDITGYVSDDVINSVNAGGTSTQTTIGTNSKPVELSVVGYGSAAVSVLGLSTGGNGSLITFKHSNGTYASPTITVNDDIIGGIEFRARNGSAYVPSSLIAVLTTDSSIGINSPSIDSTVFIGNTDAILSGSGAYLTVDPTGVVAAPVMQVGVFTDTPETRPTGVKGMIIFNDTTGKFQGFNGTTWVDLS